MAQDAEKQVLVGATHVQGMKHSVEAYDAFAEHRTELAGKTAAALVEFQAGLECLAASENFAVEVKLADVHFVVGEVGVLHMAVLGKSLPE